MCAPGFYQVIAGQLNQLDPVTGTYTPIGPVQPAYNAMGYDPIDNFLYALSTDPSNRGHLLQIADDGSIADLGLPTGLPAASYVAGAFDDVGNLIVRSSATTWYSIDVSTHVASTLTITGAADAGNDLVWMSGVAYLLNGVAPSTLYRVDLSTRVATSATVTGITSAGGSFGAAWSDNPNDLFFSDNTSGQIFLINGFTTAAPVGTLLVDGSPASTNDGAACKLAANPFEAPTAIADSYNTLINAPLSASAAAGVLTNDIGAGITVTSFTPASNGVVAVNADGSFTYTPTTGYSGPDSFTYTVTDAFNRTSTATVSLTVNLPAAPVAVDDSYTTTAGGALTQGAIGGVLSNDTGTGITVTGNTAPARGTLTLNADGSFVYTPHTGYSGGDNLNYTITDAFARTSSGIINFTTDPVAENVTGSGTGPSAFTTTPPTPLGLGPFNYSLSSHPPTADGAVSMNGATGVITFTPAPGFSGAVPTFLYTVFDSSADLSAPATIDLTVNEPAAPAAVNDSYTTTADGPLFQSSVGGLLGNDTGTGLTVTANTTPAHGTLSTATDGSFTYTPNGTFSGQDSFGYTDTDAYGRTSSATVSVTVNPVALNVTGSGTGPGAIHVTPPAPLGTGPFTYTLTTTAPAGDGTAMINATTGVITFTPAAGFHGTVPTMQYTVTDASEDVSAPADINLSVGLPSPPLVQNVSGTTTANTAITLTPAAATGTGPFTYALATTPSASDGVATIDSSTGAVTFTPAHGFSGIVPTFMYTATDGDDQVSAPADVSIDVTPLDAPASGTGPPGQPIVVHPPAPVGTGPFTYALVPGSLPPAADGTVTINPTTGAITFTPAAGFTGHATVSYTVTDADGLTSAAAVVTFDVAGTTATVPSTGAVETPMLAGALLAVAGLLLIMGAVARRTRVFAAAFRVHV